jgi:hypothetical protein
MTDSKEDSKTYAEELTDSSYNWYKSAAMRARRFHRTTEVAVIVTSAMIPISAVVLPGNSVIPALLGSVIVILTGLRASFHWQEDYVRFSRAREAVEAERRLYRTGAAPYTDLATREQALVSAITSIERDEMKSWVEISVKRQHDN